MEILYGIMKFILLSMNMDLVILFFNIFSFKFLKILFPLFFFRGVDCVTRDGTIRGAKKLDRIRVNEHCCICRLMDGECIEKLFKYFLFMNVWNISDHRIIFRKFAPQSLHNNENNFHYIIRILKAQFVK